VVVEVAVVEKKTFVGIEGGGVKEKALDVIWTNVNSGRSLLGK